MLSFLMQVIAQNVENIFDRTLTLLEIRMLETSGSYRAKSYVSKIT